MLNVNSYNVKYRVFVCVAHKLIPFHKTRRSQSPPGARPHAGTSSHGSGQRPIRCPLHTTAASPCRAVPSLARPCRAAPCLAQPCWWKATSRNRDIPGSLDSLALPRHAPPCLAPLSLDASASFPPTSCAGGGIRKLLSRVLLRACLGTHVAAQSPFRAFARPADPTRPVFTSPHFLPSRASRSQRLALAVLVLVGASSVWFQLSAGRCRATRLFRSS